MKKQLIAYASSAVVAVGMVVGCAASSDDGSAPEAAATELGEQQFVDAGSGWSVNATIQQPPSTPTMLFQASFTGPPNTSRRMGLCALEQFDWDGQGSPFGCTGVQQTLPDGGLETKQQAVDRECGNTPSAANLPTGGQRYCIGPNGQAQKYCFYRPGPQNSTWCAGSPGDPNKAPMTTSSGGGYFASLGKSDLPANTKWITDACFEGCAVTDPSSTTVTTRYAYCVGNGHGGYTCY